MNILYANLNHIKNSQNGTTLQKNENVKEEVIDFRKRNYKPMAFVCASTLAVVFAGISIAKKPAKLKDVFFENGKARLMKSGESYSGKIKDTLSSGDSIILEYEDGIIKKSQRKGHLSFQKRYKQEGSDKIIYTVKNGVESRVNMSELEKELAAKREVQMKFSEFFTSQHSNKSAKESAAVIEQIKKAEINSEAQRRTDIAERLIKDAKSAQAKFNKPFESSLSHKSASKSAEVLLKKESTKPKNILTIQQNEDGSLLRVLKTKTGTKNSVPRLLIQEEVDKNGNVISRYMQCRSKDRWPYLVRYLLRKGGFRQYTIEKNENIFTDRTKTIFSPDGKSISGTHFLSLLGIPVLCTTVKQFSKDENGKYHSEYRTQDISADVAHPDNSIIQKKFVLHSKDGQSITIIDDIRKENIQIIMRDKKGKILSDEKIDWKKISEDGGYEDDDNFPSHPFAKNIYFPLERFLNASQVEPEIANSVLHYLMSRQKTTACTKHQEDRMYVEEDEYAIQKQYEFA